MLNSQETSEESPISLPKVEDALNPGNNLFVSNLALNWTETMIEDAFSVFGKIQQIQLITDPQTKISRGFGFVCFSDHEAATEAIAALHGQTFYDKNMVVERAKRNKPRAQTPGQYLGSEKNLLPIRPRNLNNLRISRERDELSKTPTNSRYDIRFDENNYENSYEMSARRGYSPRRYASPPLIHDYRRTRESDYPHHGRGVERELEMNNRNRARIIDFEPRSYMEERGYLPLYPEHSQFRSSRMLPERYQDERRERYDYGRPIGPRDPYYEPARHYQVDARAYVQPQSQQRARSRSPSQRYRSPQRYRY